ncbi:GntR family transcriptional regulator [Pelagibacterium montanilacus]|uniref:GntR family transcriptional regulator n=1 Tax=Pelagibacterium montanilacus TaxID=2185280 RepID=UPI000F8C3571|nr:GntR family transcriptional regulator [Pelagibacterium montanilacus]
MDLVRTRVFNTVRREILACQLMPGEELRENELAQRFGVSKSPIRDAMQKLEYEGLIEIEPRRGHRVKPISIADAQDLIDLRIILECGALRSVAERATDADLAELDTFREADTTSIAAFTKYNHSFHQRVSELSRNARLEEQIRIVMENYDRLCVVSLNNPAGRDRFSGPLKDHRAIIDALQTRNGKKASVLVSKHIEKSRTSIMRGLDRRPIVD